MKKRVNLKKLVESIVQEQMNPLNFLYQNFREEHGKLTEALSDLFSVTYKYVDNARGARKSKAKQVALDRVDEAADIARAKIVAALKDYFQVVMDNT